MSISKKTENNCIDNFLKSVEKGEEYSWYRVLGIRHSAIVWARSKDEAVDLAKDEQAVQDWEDPIAHYFCKELPRVVQII